MISPVRVGKVAGEVITAKAVWLPTARARRKPAPAERLYSQTLFSYTIIIASKARLNERQDKRKLRRVDLSLRNHRARLRCSRTAEGQSATEFN